MVVQKNDMGGGGVWSWLLHINEVFQPGFFLNISYFEIYVFRFEGMKMCLKQTNQIFNLFALSYSCLNFLLMI